MTYAGPIIVLLVALLCIGLAHRIAKRKGLNPVFWGILAAAFGPFIFPVLLLMPTRTESSEQS
jgi:hypothetical protein